MLFVVVFVATRNIFTALWLSLGLIILIGYLFNEHSSFYLFGEPIPMPRPLVAPPTGGLTPEEQEIYKRLHDKISRTKSPTDENDGEKEGEKEENGTKLLRWYKENMNAVQAVIN